MSDPIIYEERRGVGILRINRPRARNALNWEAQQGFAAAVRAAGANESLRVLVITGSGSAFVAGGDLKELAERPDREAGARLNQVMSTALAQLGALPIPVIAAVNGDAAGGGCEILTACDLRIAVAGSQFKFVQVRLGLTTGWGGAARLVRLIGQSRALDILLTGRTVTAEEAVSIGLVHRLVAGGNLLPAALAWADEIVALPRNAVAAMKRLLYAAPGTSSEEAAAYERELFLDVWGAPAHLEALAAFAARRGTGRNRDEG
jgi:enoyl-CoA hydratase/carnithine racemase